jgi:hypothetical protein
MFELGGVRAVDAVAPHLDFGCGGYSEWVDAARAQPAALVAWNYLGC